MEIIAIEMFEPLHITMCLSRSDTLKALRNLCILFLLSLVDSFSAVRSFHVHGSYAEVKKRQKKQKSDGALPNVAVWKATKHFILALRYKGVSTSELGSNTPRTTALTGTLTGGSQLTGLEDLS